MHLLAYYTGKVTLTFCAVSQKNQGCLAGFQKIPKKAGYTLNIHSYLVLQIRDSEEKEMVLRDELKKLKG